jgi:hypothetical protein
MAMLDLLFGGKSFPVPKKCLFTLLEQHQELFAATTYGVESSVPLETFDLFVDSLKTQRKITVTQANAVPLWFLSREFFLAELAAECATFSVPVDQFASLSERVSELERKGSPSLSNKPARLEDEIEKIESLEEGLESLRLAVEKLREVKGGSEQPPSSSPAPASPKSIPPVRLQPTRTPSPSSSEGNKAANPKPVPPVQRKPTPKPQKSQSKVEIPMKSEPIDPSWDWENEAKSLDGIISYLTKKHGGNVQEKGIVTITSKSCPHHDLKNLADLGSSASFASEDAPGQWVCWDFREMRVRPTHYTLWALSLKSWVVEGSLDGSSWTEIDRQTNNKDFKSWARDNQKFLDWHTASFALSKPAEFRFIRLTQTRKNHWDEDFLSLRAVEFFGTLSE